MKFYLPTPQVPVRLDSLEQAYFCTGKTNAENGGINALR